MTVLSDTINECESSTFNLVLIRDCGHHAGCNRHWWIYWGNPRGLQFTNDFDVRFAYAAMSSDNQLFGRGILFSYLSIVLISDITNHSRTLFWQLCYIRFRLRWIPMCLFNFFIDTNKCALFFSLWCFTITDNMLKIFLKRNINLEVSVNNIYPCVFYW